MEENNPNNSLNIPTRQSPIAIFLIVQGLLRQLFRQFWPIFLVILLNYFNVKASNNQGEDDPYFTIAIFFIAAFSTIGSIISYFKFYYYIKEDEFIIEKGLFKKTKINIPFDRIQTINFEQNLIHQAFNVVRLEVDSAGTNKKEISLQAISREQAEAIRSYIMTEKAKSQNTDNKVIVTGETIENESDLLIHLSPTDLFKVGISQNHLRGLSVILGFGFWIFQTVEGVIPGYQEGQNPIEYLEKDLGLGTLFSIWVYLILAVIILSILISLILTVFRHFDLSFYRTQKGFKVVSGLFTKREESANINKIQLIRWEDSILKRLFGIFQLHLFQASSAAVKTRQSINVPGCYLQQINKVRATYFPKEQTYEYETHGISPIIIGRRLLYLGGIPALAIIAFSIIQNEPLQAIWAAVWLLFIFITSRIFYKNWKFHLNEEGLLIEHGILGTSFTLLKWYKIQAIKTRQSIYQQRKKVADLYFYTAAGSVKIPYVPLEKATTLTNYVLYKLEVEERDWM